MDENNKTLNYFELQAMQNSEGKETNSKETEDLEKFLESEVFSEDCTCENSEQENLDQESDSTSSGTSSGWKTACIISLVAAGIFFLFGIRTVLFYNYSASIVPSALTALALSFAAFSVIVSKLSEIAESASKIAEKLNEDKNYN